MRKGEQRSQRIKLKTSRPFGFEFRVKRSTPHEFLTFSHDKGMIRGEQEIELHFKPNAFITLSEKVVLHVVNSPPFELVVTGSCKPCLIPNEREKDEIPIEAAGTTTPISKLSIESSMVPLQEKLGNSIAAYVPEVEKKHGIVFYPVKKYETERLFQGAVSRVVKLNRLLIVLQKLKLKASTIIENVETDLPRIEEVVVNGNTEQGPEGQT